MPPRWVETAPTNAGASSLDAISSHRVVSASCNLNALISVGSEQASWNFNSGEVRSASQVSSRGSAFSTAVSFAVNDLVKETLGHSEGNGHDRSGVM